VIAPVKNASHPKIVQSLPAFSPVASRLLTITRRDNVSLKVVGDLIEMDPGLSTDVLRLANSPLYGSRSEVTGILRAVALMGLEAIRGMVLTVALRNFCRSAASAPVFRQCWRHNLACALLSGDLAEVNTIERDTGYSLGLLHDSGRLALLAARPAAYTHLLLAGAPSSEEMLIMERELFEMDHCEVGGWLAESWNLPGEFRQIMAHHHEPCGGSNELGTAFIVHMACELADMAGFPSWGPPKEWDTSKLEACLPNAGPAILDPGQLIPRIAEGINSLECTLML
jgi:HD-like signal output (HDOD) protein